MKKIFIVLIILHLCIFLFSCDVAESDIQESFVKGSDLSSSDTTNGTTSSNTDCSDGTDDFENENISGGEIAMTLSETYEDYLRFLESDPAINNFVTYENIKNLGDFICFNCYGTGTKSFDTYFYELQATDDVQFFLFVYHYERKEQTSKNVLTVINDSDLRTAETNGKSSIYVTDGITYHYRADGYLTRITWSIEGIYFSLEGNLYDIPLLSHEKSSLSQLLVKGKAKGVLEDIFADYPIESITLDTYEEYLKFVQSESLTDDFISFDEISFLGTFNKFTAFGSSIDGYKKYQYFLVSGEEKITLEICHTEAALLQPNLRDEDVNLKNMIRIPWNENSSIIDGIYEKGGVRYNYLHSYLVSIIWQMNSVRFKLYKTNSNVISLSEHCAAFKMLNANNAKEFLQSSKLIGTD